MRVTKVEMTQLKMNLLGGMASYIEGLGDEELLEKWYQGGVPDGADETDLKEIAEDLELWTDCCTLFGKLVETRKPLVDRVFQAEIPF